MAFNFSFGTDSSTGSAFSFGGASSIASTGSSFSFGADSSSSSGGFSFGSTDTSSSSAGGFSFGAADTGSASSAFSFGASSSSAPSFASSSSFSFGADTGSSFSLGSQPSFSPSGSESSSSSTGSSFSFGTETKSATTSTSEPAASSGFSFSFGGDSSSSSSSSASTGSAFSFGDTSASASSSSAAASSASSSSSTTSAIVEPASRIKNRTVEEIIALWNKDLEDHVASFIDQALEVRKWDQQLIDTGNKIVNLQKSVQGAQVAQLKLNDVLNTIRTNQQDLLHMIERLEKDVESSRGSLKPGSDELKREEAYKMAEDIDGQLMQMSDSLAEIVARLNQSTEQRMDPTNPMTNIIKILNVQAASLQWIEDTTVDLDKKLHQAHAALQQTKNERGRY